MNKNRVALLVILLLSLLLNSCRKTPGQGGNATIKGSIWIKKYDPYFTILEYEYPGADMTVELTFGNNTSPDMTINSDANGNFEFIYLRTGKYKVTLYSKIFQNAQNPSGQIPVETTVNIEKRKGSYDIGTVTLNRN
ncbi:MAG: hypothetical protein ACXVNM_14780 [Bacteroidia bacterium]